MSNVPDLQPLADDSVRSFIAQERAGPQAPLTSAVWTSDASTSYQLNARCQDFITRYLARSLITPDDANMIKVNRNLMTLAFAVSLVTLFLFLSYWIELKLGYLLGLTISYKLDPY